MKPLVFLLIVKILAFIATTVSTIGALSFFFFESLHPYRWHMLLGGMASVIMTEVITHFIAKRFGSIRSDADGIDS